MQVLEEKENKWREIEVNAERLLDRIDWDSPPEFKKEMETVYVYYCGSRKLSSFMMQVYMELGGARSEE